jgi:RsiW-degrading membrane proteinase PrsW (M82 family)
MQFIDSLSLSDAISIVIIAALLSLLPVVILLWIYYVRQKQPSVSGTSVAKFFAMGIVCVGVSVLLEKGVYSLWGFLSPGTVDLFFSENIIIDSFFAILLAGLISFGVISLVEEGSKFFFMRFLVRRMTDIDQIIDGVQLGIALGLGFAFLENTLYFLKLFRSFEFDTLVIVFFLRFLISTVGHICFGGFMGYYLTRAKFHVTEKRAFSRKAFLYPFLMHGFFDFLLAIQLSFYNVILLSVPVLILWLWWHDERLFHIYVLNGKSLLSPLSSQEKKIYSTNKLAVEIIPSMKACPNCYVPIKDGQEKCSACGAKFHYKSPVGKDSFTLNQFYK